MIIKCPSKLPSRKLNWYIFLAGPIQGAPKWQFSLPINNPKIIWLSPRRENKENFNYDEQVNWETNCLIISDIILFWIPEPIEKIEGRDYAQTTRIEFGEYLARGKKIIIGINKNFPGRKYFEYKCKKYKINKLHDNLNDCIKEVEEYINNFHQKKTIFYISDTHFGSERALNLSKRPFKSVEEMNWKLIENWNKKIHINDIVYHLGDFGELWPLQYLNGKIYLIAGNYEKELINKNKEYKNELEKSFEKVFYEPIINEDFEYSKKVLCHEPLDGLKKYKLMKEKDLDKYKNLNFILFGHIHGRQKIKDFGIDVGIDANNYNPISEVEVEFYRKAISEGHYDLEVFCNKFSIQKNPKNKHKVFLGGTCNRSKWRNELIELLEIDYFNPVVKNWNQDCQKEEERQKNFECDLQVYVITPEINGFFSIAEVAEAAINLRERCIFCILDLDSKFSEQNKYSLKAVIDLVKKYDAKYFDNLYDIANYLNNFE
jgi:calcineurin-like phosphoesterase family protein